MKNVNIIDHPLIRHKLTFLRDKKTSTKEFRDLIREMSMLMGYEVMRGLSTTTVDVETPFEKTKCKHLQTIHKNGFA